MSHLPLNALRVFEAVARTGSFRRAAEALFVTQSAVSHQIRHLEDWLGTPLFDREGSRPRLLPHGEELARALSLSLSEIENACQRVRSHRDGPLVIAAIPSVAVCWLIPRLAGFRALHPEIEIRVIYAMHGRDIDFRDAHLAFVFAAGLPERPGIRAEAFLPGVSVPVCSPLALARLGKAKAGVEDILALGLLHDTDSSGWRSWLQRAGHAAPAQSGGPVFEDFNLLRAAALAGQGGGALPGRDDPRRSRFRPAGAAVGAERAGGVRLLPAFGPGRRHGHVARGPGLPRLGLRRARRCPEAAEPWRERAWLRDTCPFGERMRANADDRVAEITRR